MATNTLILILTIICPGQSLKIFLLGGAVTEHQPNVYINMAKATGKTPQPNNCSQDWSTTTCPKVAVITSAAPNEQDGNDCLLVPISLVCYVSGNCSTCSGAHPSTCPYTGITTKKPQTWILPRARLITNYSKTRILYSSMGVIRYGIHFVGWPVQARPSQCSS